MATFIEEMAQLLTRKRAQAAAEKQVAEVKAAAATTARAAEQAARPARPLPDADRPRAGGRLLDGIAVASHPRRSGHRPGGAAASTAPGNPAGGGPGWRGTDPGEKIGYAREVYGPEPATVFAASLKSPEPEPVTDPATAAGKRHADDRAFQEMMNAYQVQNSADSGRFQ